MKRTGYGLHFHLPQQVADVVPELKCITASSFMHCHDFYEIEIFVDGTGVEVLNGVSRTVQRGQVTLLSLSDFHEVIPHGQLYFYNYMFRPSMLSPELQHAIWDHDGNQSIGLS